MANTCKGCVILCLIGTLLLAACEPTTPTPVAQMPSSTKTPAVSTLPAYPGARATPAASPASPAYPAAPPLATPVPQPPPPTFTPGPTPTPWPTRTPFPPPPTPTPIILAAPVVTTTYLAPLGTEKAACPQYIVGADPELWQDLLTLNGRSYRRPLADISDAELVRIGHTLFPKGLPLHLKYDTPGLFPAVVHILDATRYDLDGDGQAENIYAYLVPRFVPIPDQLDPPYFWDGPMYLAILSTDNKTVRWQSPNDLNYVGISGEMLHRPCTFVAPYQITPGVPGLLFYRWVQIDGSGGGGEDWVTIYAWQNGAANQVWEDRGSRGNRVGGGYNHYETSHIHLIDVDTDGIPEVLKTTIIQTSQGGGVPTTYDFHFRLHQPGSLAYKWTGQGYTACALRPRDDAATLWPLRCDVTPFYASLVSSTVTLDGDLSEWGQYEYHRLHASTPATCYFLGSGNLNAMWDSDTLYLGLLIPWERVYVTHLQLWFDVDLAGDFDSTVLNQDDVLIDVTLPQDAAGAPQVAVMRPDANGQWQPDPAATARVRAVGRLELAIPLEILGLKDALQGIHFGTVEYETDFSSTIPFAVYRPRAVRAIGFAAMLNKETVGRTGRHYRESISGHNPTTWGTLIFMAED